MKEMTFFQALRYLLKDAWDHFFPLLLILLFLGIILWLVSISRILAIFLFIGFIIWIISNIIESSVKKALENTNEFK